MITLNLRQLSLWGKLAQFCVSSLCLLSTEQMYFLIISLGTFLGVIPWLKGSIWFHGFWLAPPEQIYWQNRETATVGLVSSVGRASQVQVNYSRVITISTDDTCMFCFQQMDLATFLIDRACHNYSLANYLYWYLLVESDDQDTVDSRVTQMYQMVLKRFNSSLIKVRHIR